MLIHLTQPVLPQVSTEQKRCIQHFVQIYHQHVKSCYLNYRILHTVEVPCIDDCHRNSVPPDVHVPSSGSEAELAGCGQHINEINTSHEPVTCFNNGWSGKHYVSFGFAILAFHISQFKANKRGNQVHCFVVIPSYIFHLSLLSPLIFFQFSSFLLHPSWCSLSSCSSGSCQCSGFLSLLENISSPGATRWSSFSCNFSYWKCWCHFQYNYSFMGIEYCHKSHVHIETRMAWQERSWGAHLPAQTKKNHHQIHLYEKQISARGYIRKAKNTLMQAIQKFQPKKWDHRKNVPSLVNLNLHRR